jgi:hypothetical protein
MKNLSQKFILVLTFLFLYSCASSSLITQQFSSEDLYDLRISEIKVDYAQSIQKDNKLEFLLITEIKESLGFRFSENGKDTLVITVEGLRLIEKLQAGLFGAFAGGNELTLNVSVISDGKVKGSFIVEDMYNPGGYAGVINVEKVMAERVTKQIIKNLGI